MGITIHQYPLYDVSLSDVYVNIRDLRTTKTELGAHKLEFAVHYIKNFNNTDHRMRTRVLSVDAETPFTNMWADAYTKLKSVMNDENMQYTDT